MRKALALFFACLLMLACGVANAGENLLENGSFENTQDDWPLSWREDAWLYGEGITDLRLVPEGRDGGLCVIVENFRSNDARFTQTVAVEPLSIYRLSGWIKAENISPEHGGAGINLLNQFEYFPEVYDTGGEWVYIEFYFQTHENQRAVDVAARVGFYSADNTGKAWFDDITLEKAEEVPQGVELIYLHPLTAPAVEPEPEVKAEKTVERFTTIHPAIWALWMAMLLYALWMLRVRRMPNWKGAVWVLLALAAAVRLYLMAAEPGFKTDMNCFSSWANTMVVYGPGKFYENAGFCDYPPGYMYLLWITGVLLNLFNASAQSMLGRVLIKIVPLAADLAAVYLIFRLARERLGNMPAVLLAALYAFSPAVLVDGAVWGQVDSVIALGLVATLVLAMEGKWRFALPVYIVSVLMKPQALLAGPVGLLALIFDIVSKKEEGNKVVIDAAKGLLGGFILAAAMLLPFMWTKENPIGWVYDLYKSTLGSYAYATVSATNLYYLMGANWVSITEKIGPVTYATLGYTLMALVYVFVLGLYAIQRKREALPLYGALLFIGIFLFAPKMHERYLFPALILLAVAYIYRRDFRILILFAGFSVTFAINCAIVLWDTYLPLGFGFWGCVLSAVNLILFGIAVWTAVDKRTLTLPDIVREKPDRLSALSGRTPRMARMTGKDWGAMLSLTLVYAAVAYIGLGSALAPQTEWESGTLTNTVEFDLGETRQFQVLYYGGISQQNFTLEFSDDGEAWRDTSPAELDVGHCFRWKYLTQAVYDAGGNVSGYGGTCVFEARYVRLLPNGASVSVMEIAFQGLDGEVLPVQPVKAIGGVFTGKNDPALLVDEQDTVPAYPSYYNSTYFDEIYHARTGYEHAKQLSAYEWTHPPLGKVLIMLGIKMFGMTPFGWRFMGALMGVLMVPAMYMLGKLLFRRTRFALLAAFVMALDMMHLTQTRIATIDSYAVLCIILMYLCMFRYLQMSFFRDGWRTLVPLGLSGLFMGLGCASKWICMYAGAGLAVLFFWSLAQRFLEWLAAGRAGDEALMEQARRFPRYAIGTLLFCLGFFIIIPAAIYYLSYIPHFAGDGGLTWERFWDTQKRILSYHANLVDDHAFQSPWYEWLLMLKPMYYYNGSAYVGEGLVSTIMCLGNPAVWWVGLGTLLYTVCRWLKANLRGEAVRDKRLAMLLIAFLAQYLPWILVPRSMYIYHYFGSLPFVMLTVVYAFEQLYMRKPDLARIAQMVYMGVVLALFIGFYPVATGTPVSVHWADAMNWLGFLKLPGWKYRGWLYY